MKYCPISTTLFNLASMQNLLTLSVCERLLIRSSHCCNRKFWKAGSSFSKRTSVLISLSTIDCPITLSGCPNLSWRDSYSSHMVRECSVETELICRNNCAKNSLNRCLVGTIVNRQFSMSFASELTSGQWSRCTENWTSAFGEFHQHLFRDVIPNFLVDHPLP